QGRRSSGAPSVSHEAGCRNRRPSASYPYRAGREGNCASRWRISRYGSARPSKTTSCPRGGRAGIRAHCIVPNENLQNYFVRCGLRSGMTFFPLAFSREHLKKSAAKTNPNQTRRFFGGRQPLCGIGVMSLMERTSIPAVDRARTADSRPLPGPATRTSTVRTPDSFALLAAVSDACCAANGVPLREPRKPSEPELDQASTFPMGSVNVIIVLLNDACTCTIPNGMFFFSFFLKLFFFVDLAGAFAICFSLYGCARSYGCAVPEPVSLCGGAIPGRLPSP